MAAPLVVTLRLRWRPAEPDGATRCDRCGDVPWLKLWRLETRVGGGGWRDGQLALCDACRDPRTPV